MAKGTHSAAATSLDVSALPSPSRPACSPILAHTCQQPLSLPAVGLESGTKSVGRQSILACRTSLSCKRVSPESGMLEGCG